MEMKLVPLRIPPGWTVCLNKFTEVTPDLFVDEDYEYYWEFDEDILLLKNDLQKRTLDLGWYPSFNPKGQYYLKLIQLVDECDEQPEFWEKPLVQYESRDIKDIQQRIEQILSQVSKGLL